MQKKENGKMNQEQEIIQENTLTEEELDEELSAIESFEEGMNEDSDKLVSALQKEKEEYMNMLKRERADFENYKKRNSDLAACSYANGVADAVKSVLPVIDNLERALASSDCADGALTNGVEMIRRQLSDTLASFGLEEIEAEGQPFDPQCMDAVMQVEKAEEQDSNCVAEVLQKGYKLNGKVLRCAMVKVTD
jgi:molecular chaperone GrpE